MKRVPRTLTGAAALLALSVAGCGDAPPDAEAPPDPDADPSASDGVVDLPGDDQPGEPSPDGMTGGVLAADDQGCVWLIDEPVKDEPFEPEVALFWPADHSFDPSTREILDPAGEVVASIGDRVALGGGETQHRRPEWPERCDAVDRVWSVSSIERRGRR